MKLTIPEFPPPPLCYAPSSIEEYLFKEDILEETFNFVQFLPGLY